MRFDTAGEKFFLFPSVHVLPVVAIQILGVDFFRSSNTVRAAPPGLA